MTNSELLSEPFPAGTGYRSFSYHQKDSGNAMSALGAYGQACYMNPAHEVVIAMFSSTPPWQAQRDAGVTFDELYAQDMLQERERWNLYHEVAKLVSQ